MRLYVLHSAAANCESRKCTRKYERRRAKLERRIRKARAHRLARWNKLTCPLIAPSTTEFLTTTTTTTTTTLATDAPTDAPTTVLATDAPTTVLATDALTTVLETTTETPTTAAPTASPENARRASLHLRLNQIYLSIDQCQDDNCRKQLNEEKSAIERELRFSSEARRVFLEQSRERHLRRARLNLKLNSLYTSYSQCTNADCRNIVNADVATFRSALEKLDRDMLGAKLDGGDEIIKGVNQNEYIRMLRNALKNCGSTDKPCRDAVFEKFAVQTEQRHRAVLFLLTERIAAKVRSRVAACATTANAEQCVADVQKWEAKRLADIQSRQDKIERRRQIRMCKKLPNEADCIARVSAAFVADVKAIPAKVAVAAAEQVKSAVADVAPQVAAPVTAKSGEVVAGRSASSASKLVVGVISVLVLAAIF
jgi:hypothetical protein